MARRSSQLRWGMVLVLLAQLRIAVASVLPSPFPAEAFPIGVWLQQPVHARKYKDLGINLYVGLWEGPTSAQLEALKLANMPVICTQNEVGLIDRNRNQIVGWLQQDEPDNAQPLLGKVGLARFGWGSPVPPEELLERYRAIRLRDASRPVLLNLGKGVAWDPWKGRGSRTGHPEDYPLYAMAADILSFDIYPAVETDQALTGRLEVVAQGVKRLVTWAGPHKTVWNAIGASKIRNPSAVLIPEQIRSQVWMSIVNGSRGIIYFVHQFKPSFIEASLLDNPDIAYAISKINSQVQGLAKVILSPASADIESTRLSAAGREVAASENIALTSRRYGCALYVFAVSLRNEPQRARIRLKQVPGTKLAPTKIEVIDERRKLMLENGGFEDEFAPYAVHLYVTASQEAFCSKALPGQA